MSNPAEHFAGVDLREAGRKGGRASAAARRAKKKLSADLLFREALEAESEELGKRLLDAAFGRNAFATLDLKDQLAALKLALEHGVGRPRPSTPKPQEDEDEPVEGLAFGVADPVAPSAPGSLAESNAPLPRRESVQE